MPKHTYHTLLIIIIYCTRSYVSVALLLKPLEMFTPVWSHTVGSHPCEGWWWGRKHVWIDSVQLQCNYRRISDILGHLGFHHKGLESKLHITLLSPLDKKSQNNKSYQQGTSFLFWAKRGILLEPSSSTPLVRPRQKLASYSCILMVIYHYYTVTAGSNSPVQLKPTNPMYTPPPHT